MCSLHIYKRLFLCYTANYRGIVASAESMIRRKYQMLHCIVEGYERFLSDVQFAKVELNHAPMNYCA